jgi:predicted Zn-dependent peptidase
MTLIHLAGEHYRTGRLTAVLSVPLAESTAAEYAILPGLLTHASRRYPSVAALTERLDELYGASVQAGIERIGSWQTLTFSVRFLREQYTFGGEHLINDCAELLLDLLFDPLLENGVFTDKDFSREQRCLLERLQSEINNKRLYARQQCKKLLCPDEAYSVNHNGTPDSVAALTPAIAAEARERLLASARIHWIYQGDDAPDALIRSIEARFATIPLRRAAQMMPDSTFVMKQSERTEEMPLKQAKLVLGFRIAATEPSDDVMAARLMNTLWGGSPSSLLFRHVREEQSLCYYCSSVYDTFHGVIFVDSGIEAADAERTREEVLKQLSAIREGNFSDEELEAARRSLVQRFTAMNETPADREWWTVGQTIYDRYVTTEQAVSALLAVTRDDVVRMAKLVHFDATYLLKPTTNA